MDDLRDHGIRVMGYCNPCVAPVRMTTTTTMMMMVINRLGNLFLGGFVDGSEAE